MRRIAAGRVLTAISTLTLGALLASCANDSTPRNPDRGPGDAPPTTAPVIDRAMFLLNSAGGTATSTGGLGYSVRLDSPSTTISAYGGRPLESAAQLSLTDWVAGWAPEYGFDANPPSAVVRYTDESGNARSVVIRITAPRIDAEGALHFEAMLQASQPGVATVYPKTTFTDLVMLIDDEKGLETAKFSEGLFILSGESGQLAPGTGPSCPKTLTVAAVPNVFAISQTPTRAVGSSELEQFVENWARRGFYANPPRVALASVVGGHGSGSSVVELSNPKLQGSDGVQFCVTPVGDPGASSDAVVADLAVTGPNAATVVFGGAQIYPSNECFSDADCEGNAACKLDPTESFNLCVFLACVSDDDCDPVEYCSEFATPSGDTGSVCFPNETCDLTVVDPPSTCAAPALCDSGARCAPIGCDTHAECAPKSQSRGDWYVSEGLCIDNVCQLSPHPYEGLLSQQGVIFGTTWSAPQLNTACFHAPGSALAEFCTVTEFAVEDRAINLMGMLSSYTNAHFSYYGRNWFDSISEGGALASASGTPAHYPFPSESLQASIFGPFGMIDTAFVNYTSRLLGDIDNEFPYRYPFSDAEDAVPTDTAAFLNKYFTDYQSVVGVEPPGNVIKTGSEIELISQFGGGGGYGCYFGTITLDTESQTYSADAPMLQVGGGFGFGVSESTGLDFGLGGGISFCKSNDCSRQLGRFYGGGGGINWRLVGDPVTNSDSQPKDGFVDLLNSEDGTGVLDSRDFFYLYCGSGGGLGFQSRPTVSATDSTPTSKYFTPIWDIGGGGNSWVIFKRVAVDEAGKGNPLSDPELVASHAGFSTNLLSFLEANEGDNLVLPGGGTIKRPWNAQRGAYTADDVAKAGVAGSAIANGDYGFAYEPYHFPLPANVPLDSGAAEVVYIPGSNANAALYFAQASAHPTLATSDPLAMTQLGVQRALYALNTNPLNFDYASGSYDAGAKFQWNPVLDINEDAIVLLSGVTHGAGDEPTEIVLTVPLYVQHTTSNESTVPPMVSQNQWALDEAVALAKANTNIKSIMLGAGGPGVVQAFDTLCNSYTYSKYSPPSPTSGIAAGQKNTVNCTRYESSLEFVDYYDLLNYVSGLIAGTTLGGQNNDQDLSISRAISIGINQALDLPNADGTTRVAATSGKDEMRLGWLTPTTIKQNGAANAGPSHALIDYWKLTAASDKSDWAAVKKFLFDIDLPDNVTLKAMFTADLVEWSALYAANNTPGPDITQAIASGDIAPLDALKTALTAVDTASANDGPSLKDSILQTGWFGTQVASGASTIVAGLEAIAAASESYSDLSLSLYFDQLFDQPWKSLPALLPGMPDSICGHTFTLPHLTPDNPSGPPLPGNLPTECAPDFYGVPVPGTQPHPTCLCLTNITNYPVTFSPFISDVTPLSESGANLVVPPNSVVTWQRGSNPATVDPNTDAPESQAAAFYDGGIANKDGAFNLAAQWKQWPEQLVGACLLWDGTPCAPTNKGGGAATVGGEVPDAIAGDALPALRCVGVSDAQNGAGSANAGFQCPQVWYQYYCDGSTSSTPCKTPLKKDYSFPWGNDWEGNPVGFTWTSNDPWDLECKPQGGGPVLQPNVTTVTRIDPAVKGATGHEGCTKVQWTAKGSAYDEVTGWMLKTLEPPQPPPGSTIRREAAASPKIARENLTFQLAPMTIISAQEQTLNAETSEVSVSYTFCPVKDPTKDATSSNQYFAGGLTKGQYWFRIQPMGGTSGSAAEGTLEFLPSVDAIDMEFDPVCHLNDGTTDFTRVGKFTIDFPMPDISNQTPLNGQYSKVAKIVFKLPDLDGGVVKGSTFTVTPPVDNGIADFSLPGQSPNCTATGGACPAFTTVMEFHFNEVVEMFGPDNPCTVLLDIVSGKDAGNQGGQAKLTNGAAATAADACFLELDNSKKFVNGANLQFCGTPAVCAAPNTP